MILPGGQRPPQVGCPSYGGKLKAGESSGDVLLDLRWSKSAFGVVAGGRDAQVTGEPQDVAGPVAEGLQQ